MSHALPPIAVVIVAAGRGARFGGEVPKQYRALAGKPVLAHTLAAFGAVAAVGRILTVIHLDYEADYERAALASGVAGDRLGWCAGGASRQESVRLGLEALAGEQFDGVVLIHDAARPFASEALISRAIFAALRHGAAIPVLPVADTLASLDGAGNLAGNPDRETLRRVQTPQSFRFHPVLLAHRQALAEGRSDFTDDASLAAAYGHKVATFEGDEAVFKITVEADLARAERHLVPAARETRTGMGYDVHSFAEGDAVWLGGVKIPYSRKLSGHSDADVLLHALVDALLGTIGDGDIGQHFPPSDERWRGAPSRLFLEDAARRVREAGGRIVNVDCTIIAEAPKVGPHRPAMQALIGEVLGLAPARVGIKATTNEKMGFVGRGEGIAAFAVASVAF
ncbi:MAG: bifunctional 2-C-methyl-D-erythritol 4-phosphate cytidylyltransferase/2-C-methyl-D-erythritol 2,4-cyclodiphosphate synthase [Proteobacteria bacterium]|nr:bifunctional 2-C-methyl-D-erythritol 4-phosphate cytidylyltransferase/2-C-methyl-D-erythritol 2,4-cyclodiphosphate synthase [Pseudomonadota bacterium]